MSEDVALQFEYLPDNLANHLLITILPLLCGMAVSLPLALVAVRIPRLRYPTLTVVSIVQTIPSLALLALMVPLLVGVNAVTSRWLDWEISALGFYPTVTALTLYSMLPMLRNTVTGILDVDPALTEAARGVGMTPLQSLWKVELPLALPVIIAGIRTATVWTVGIATLATPVGQRCLGNYIFRGLQTRNWTAVLFGCVSAAVVAIVLDLLIGGLQQAAAERRRKLAVLSGTLLAAATLGGLLAPTAVGWFRDTLGRGRPLVVGAKTFTEQYILADVIEQSLRQRGFATRSTESLGSTVVFDGLVNNEIDVYVDYTGTIWANHMHREGSASPQKVLDEVSTWLAEEYGARCLGPLGFENAYALAVRREHAEELGLTTIGDLASYAARMKIGGDYEFFGRPEWLAVREAYGVNFAEYVSYDSTFMYDALVNRDVDVIAAFSSDGRIAANDLVVLDDPKNAIPPYDAVVLLSPQAAARPGVAAALAPLLGSIDVATMRQANYLVDREKDKATVAEAAKWLLLHVKKARSPQPEANP